jgi:predicted DCC family thiol-disulfide oxidoreductase YuxK
MLSYLNEVINSWRTAFYKDWKSMCSGGAGASRSIFTGPSPPPLPDTAPLVFYDGQCGLCDRSVRWLLRRDRDGRLRFAPLQGTTAAALLAYGPRSNLTTLVLLDKDGVHVRSEAAIRAVIHLGGAWRLAHVLRSVPRRMRDRAYDLVARRRHRWFGRVEHCHLPEPDQRSRFLP